MKLYQTNERGSALDRTLPKNERGAACYCGFVPLPTTVGKEAPVHIIQSGRQQPHKAFGVASQEAAASPLFNF
jgi:hypothetical protein